MFMCAMGGAASWMDIGCDRKIILGFLRVRMVDVVAAAPLAMFTLKIWFLLVLPHFFFRTATWAALSITKANLDVNSGILIKTMEMLVETLRSGSRPLCIRQWHAEVVILKAWGETYITSIFLLRNDKHISLVNEKQNLSKLEFFSLVYSVPLPPFPHSYYPTFRQLYKNFLFILQHVAMNEYPYLN